AKNCRREECLQAVEVGLWNGLELVVVAASTADREPEKNQARGVGHVVKRVLPALALGGRIRHVRAQQVEARCDPRPRVVGKQLVASQLFLEKAVVRLVTIERLDDIVAISPGIGPDFIKLVAVAFGETDQVEPVSTPALAIVRRSQEAVDDPLPGVW